MDKTAAEKVIFAAGIYALLASHQIKISADMVKWGEANLPNGNRIAEVQEAFDVYFGKGNVTLYTSSDN